VQYCGDGKGTRKIEETCQNDEFDEPDSPIMAGVKHYIIWTKHLDKNQNLCIITFGKTQFLVARDIFEISTWNPDAPEVVEVLKNAPPDDQPSDGMANGDTTAAGSANPRPSTVQDDNEDDDDDDIYFSTEFRWLL